MIPANDAYGACSNQENVSPLMEIEPDSSIIRGSNGRKYILGRVARKTQVGLRTSSLIGILAAWLKEDGILDYVKRTYM